MLKRLNRSKYCQECGLLGPKEPRRHTGLGARIPPWELSHSGSHLGLPSLAGGRAVLTNGHTGHVPRAPGFFFVLRGPQLAVVK